MAWVAGLGEALLVRLQEAVARAELRQLLLVEVRQLGDAGVRVALRAEPVRPGHGGEQVRIHAARRERPDART